ncbi:hypothetical protein TRFO_37853 [Tritrichomonas foetus]|uniref:Uncharacterized protein n=1 Tax=Tritrichomonas foetus TaxID=1144522 RepID=A0A1J4JEW6_9EUKA|nr:hypothetical protein TRFO_37853 [Tritrichomonas foetus]|eukprot:OHS95989.1 hypothetical protein TRFO_37853 [Tritrichomonas foetus]
MSSLRQKSIDSDSLSNSLLKFKTNLIESCITQLLTETNLLIINPSFLHHISSVFIVLQIIFGGFFLHSKNFTFPDWFEFILQVVFIGFSEKKYNRSLHWVLFILDLFSFLLIKKKKNDYILTRHIRKFFLKLLRYWNCELLNMLIIPNVLQKKKKITHYGTDPNLFTLT